MDIILDWVPKDFLEHDFLWKIERGEQLGSEWSSTNGKFDSSGKGTTITWTAPSSGTVYRRSSASSTNDEIRGKTQCDRNGGQVPLQPKNGT